MAKPRHKKQPIDDCNIELAYKYVLPSTMRELELLSYSINKHNISLKYVLDVGCGVGHAIRLLGKLGARGIGIDLNERVIQGLRKNLQDLDFEFNSIDFLTYTTRTPFNLITMLAVLEHQADDGQFLEVAFKLLDENGYLIIVVPAHSKQYCMHDKIYGHYRRYDRLPLKLLLQSQGFEVVDLFSYGFQLIQIINSVFANRQIIKDKEQATVFSSIEIPAYYKKLYPLFQSGIYPYTWLQRLIKNTDYGNAYFVVCKKFIH